MAYQDLLEAELQIFQIRLTELQKFALLTYCDELEKWNRSINLTALSGGELIRRLIAEPIWIAQELSLTDSLVDIGSGNGSPAIPFQITCPSLACHLIEARVKRVAFLRHIVTKLNLTQVRVYRSRFEEIAASLPSIAWISLQAVSLTDRLLDSIRTIASATTTVVWITSPRVRTVLRPIKALTVPHTGTQVLLFRLDLS